MKSGKTLPIVAALCFFVLTLGATLAEKGTEVEALARRTRTPAPTAAPTIPSTKIYAARIYSAPNIDVTTIHNGFDEAVTWETVERGIYAMSIPSGFQHDKTSVLFAQQNAGHVAWGIHDTGPYPKKIILYGYDNDGNLADFVVRGDILITVFP